MNLLNIGDLELNDFVKHKSKDISGKVTKKCNMKFGINNGKCVYTSTYFNKSRVICDGKQCYINNINNDKHIKKHTIETGPFVTELTEYDKFNISNVNKTEVIVFPYMYDTLRLTVSLSPSIGQDKMDSVRWLLLKGYHHIENKPLPFTPPDLNTFGVYYENMFITGNVSNHITSEVVMESSDLNEEEFDGYDPYNVVLTFYKKLWPDMGDSVAATIC